MTKQRKFSVIWKNDSRIEFYQNGIWNGHSYTTPTLIKVLHPAKLSHMKLPQIYAAFRYFERTGVIPR